jgi:hypothetical protein
MISEIAAHSSRTWTRNTDPDAVYREDVLSLLACLKLEPAEAIAFIEAGTGRPFEACRPMHLVPLLQELLELVRSPRSPVDSTQLEL